MSVQELRNRGDNLLAIGITAIAGLALIPEILVESGSAMADDIIVLLLGLGGLVWYFTSENRYKRSIVPFVFVGLSFIVKLYSTFMESGSAISMSDDVLTLGLFILASVVAIWLYVAHGEMGEKSKTVKV